MTRRIAIHKGVFLGIEKIIIPSVGNILSGLSEIIVVPVPLDEIHEIFGMHCKAFAMVAGAGSHRLYFYHKRIAPYIWAELVWNQDLELVNGHVDNAPTDPASLGERYQYNICTPMTYDAITPISIEYENSSTVDQLQARLYELWVKKYQK